MLKDIAINLSHTTRGKEEYTKIKKIEQQEEKCEMGN
jgi:hypothetical protein